jgi:hypothetical protein
MKKMFRKHWDNLDELEKLANKLSNRDVKAKISKLGKGNVQSGGAGFFDRFTVPSGFSVQVDKFTIHRLIESLNSPNNNSVDGPSVQFFVGSYNTKYRRNNKGELVNKKGERFEEGSNNFNKLSRNDKC